MAGITPEPKSYTLLARELFNKEFYFYSSEDVNVYEWALYLRHALGFNLDSYCSVFEVLVTLAYQWEHRYGYDNDIGDQIPVWFAEMLKNAGLDSFNDLSWSYDAIIITDDIISRILDRQYAPNGIGGLFPLKNPVPGFDARELGLLDQLAHYINEKYDQIW